MALSHSPSIITNGLVYYHDMGNTLKSWKGAPATNLYTDGDYSSGALHPVRSGTWAIVEDPRDSTKKVLKATPSASNQYHGKDITSVVSTLYSLQMQIYVSTDFNGTLVSMYPEQGGSGAARYYDLTKKGTWQSLKYDGISASTTNIRMLAYVLSAFTTGYVLISNTGVEQNAFATPFVAGTRSNTQAIVDLRNTNTVTANLTYASDNTFSFDYTLPGYISVPLSTAFNKTEGTMNFWLYPTRYNGGNGYFVNREDATANATDWFWIGPYSDTFYFRIGNGTDCCSNDLSFGSVSTVIPLNNWINMCFTWKANGTSVIYKNGVLHTSRAIGNIPNTNPAANGRLGLGHGNLDSYFNGKMPIAQIYNRQFTAAEVLQNFNALRGRYGV